MTYTIKASGLTKSYGDTVVLDRVDLRIRAGEIFALLGPNGAGKTTTVNILSTLLRADGGEVAVAGFDLATQPLQVRSAISLTGQYAAVDEVLTGRENLVMMARLRHLPKDRVRRRADELLDQFDLGDAADRRAVTYSGGMRRRLDLAMSLVTVPVVLFLDEPTNGLDPRSRREVWDAVTTLAGSGVTVLLTTQYLEEADQLADRIAVLAGGRIVDEGTAAELKSRIGSETLVLAFDTVALAHRAAALLAMPGEPALAVDETSVTVGIPTDGSAGTVLRTLTSLSAAGVPAARVDMHTPTLDEVFLHLTDTTTPSTLERTA